MAGASFCDSPAGDQPRCCAGELQTVSLHTGDRGSVTGWSGTSVVCEGVGECVNWVRTRCEPCRDVKASRSTGVNGCVSNWTGMSHV